MEIMPQTNKNILMYRGIMFSENVHAFFETSENGHPLPAIIGRDLEDVMIGDGYHPDLSDPNKDGSFPVFSDDDDMIYVGKLFVPITE
jgi:hypothetical protein